MKKHVYCKFIVVIVLLVLFSNFTLNAQNPHKEKALDEYGTMMITPDSLLSKEMRATKHKLIRYYFNCTDVINGKLVFNQNKDNNSDSTISKVYIEKMKKEIDGINNWTDTVGRNAFMKSFYKTKETALTKLSGDKE